MADGKFVAYYRVSTVQQGLSGLGLEAQQAAVAQHLGLTRPLAEFTEVETGKGSNALARRPQLLAALSLAKKHKATLIVAKLDRLARNVAFISHVMDSKVDFLALDTPYANRLTLHILAAVAEHEREMTSQRTKAALAAAKARGKVLGSHGRVLAAQNRAEATAWLAPISERLLAFRRAKVSMRQIAETLNAEGVASRGGGRWHVETVRRALERLGEEPLSSTPCPA